MLVSQAWNGGHVVVTNHSCESWTSFLCKVLFSLYWISFRADTNNVTIRYSKNSNSTELKRSGWPNRVWWTYPNPHSWIFTSVSANSSSPSHLFTSPTVRIPVHIAPKCGKEHIRDRRRAASLRYRTRAEIAVLMCQLVVDPDLQITGGGGPQFGLKLRGGGALPWIPHCRTEALSDVVRAPAQKLSDIVWT